MKRKFLDLYHQWMSDGRLPGDSGLCKAFKEVGMGYYFLRKRFEAHNHEMIDLWYESIKGDFNGVRQNVVLLLAAMNGEL